KKIAPMMDGEPKYPRYRLDSLADLRNLAHSTGLVEHISDATTVTLLHYPTAVRVITQKKTSSNQGQISLVGGEEAEIQFVDDVRAFGFFYQQGMFHISLEVTMSDGNKVNAEGGEFFPDTNFFGFHSPVPIRSLRISSNPKGGSLILWSFYFYSTSSHQRRFSAQ